MICHIHSLSLYIYINCVYIYIYNRHTHIHTYIHTYTHTHIHTYTHTYTHVRTRTYTYIHVHTRTYTYIALHCIASHRNMKYMFPTMVSFAGLILIHSHNPLDFGAPHFQTICLVIYSPVGGESLHQNEENASTWRGNRPRWRAVGAQRGKIWQQENGSRFSKGWVKTIQDLQRPFTKFTSYFGVKTRCHFVWPTPNHQHPRISHICSPDFQFFKHL